MCSFAAWFLASRCCAFPAHRRVAAIAVNRLAAWLRCEFTACALSTGFLIIARATLLRAIFSPGFSANGRLCARVHMATAANP